MVEPSFLLWSTKKELKFIDYLASEALRNGKRIRQKDKIIRLQGYLDTVSERRWDCNVDAIQCRIYAQNILNFLVSNMK